MKVATEVCKKVEEKDRTDVRIFKNCTHVMVSQNIEFVTITYKLTL